VVRDGAAEGLNTREALNNPDLVIRLVPVIPAQAGIQQVVEIPGFPFARE
jgi:hypothetical protein